MICTNKGLLLDILLSLDTLSMLARNVGSAEFQPLAVDSIKLGIQLIAETDDPDIRKSTYGLFGSVSYVLKADMGPFLESIVLPILNTIKDQQAYIVSYLINLINYVNLNKFRINVGIN